MAPGQGRGPRPYRAGQITDKTIEFIRRKHAEDRPFYVSLALVSRLEAEAANGAAENLKMAAALEIVRELAALGLIEEAALTEATEVVSTTLAIEDAAELEVVEALVASELIEEAAAPEAVVVVRATQPHQARDQSGLLVEE